MVSRFTKAVTLLAAIAMCFALVCPVAVTPIFVQSHHSPSAMVAIVLAQIVAIITAMRMAVQAHDSLPVFIPVPTQLNCVQLC